MADMGEWLYLIIGIVVVGVVLLVGLVASGRRRGPGARTDVIAPPEPGVQVPTTEPEAAEVPAEAASPLPGSCGGTPTRQAPRRRARS